jgi:hypothetical protein
MRWLMYRKSAGFGFGLRDVRNHDAMQHACTSLIIVLSFDADVVDEGAEIGRLVPADGVVVHIHLPQAAHHLHLVLCAVFLVFCCLRHGSLHLTLLLAGECKAVGHFKCSANVQTQQLPCNKARQGILAVLDQFQHDLPESGRQRAAATRGACMTAPGRPAPRRPPALPLPWPRS